MVVMEAIVSFDGVRKKKAIRGTKVDGGGRRRKTTERKRGGDDEPV